MDIESSKPEVNLQEVKDELSQVVETFDSLEATGEHISTETLDPNILRMQDMMSKHMSAMANHQPGKEFKLSNVTYVVQAYPHNGMWVRQDKRIINSPNIKNHSVRKKLAKNPGKYITN